MMYRALTLLLLAASVGRADDWPGWRGDGSGVSSAAGVPVGWSAERNVLWKVRVPGDGISSPIAWGDRVYLTTAIGRPSKSCSPLIAIPLALVAIGLALGALLAEGRPRGWMRLCDSVVALAGIAAFGLGTHALFLRPDYMAPGTNILAYRWSAVVAVSAAIVAFRIPGAGAGKRMLGAITLAVVIVLFLLAGPERRHSSKEIKFVTAMGCVAAWWLFSAILCMRGRRDPQLSLRPRLGRVAAVVLLAAAGWEGLVATYCRPRTRWSRAVLCLDRDSGAAVWEKEVFVTGAVTRHPGNSYATPTPATDGTCVAADFDAGLACLEMDGRIRWKKARADHGKHLVHGRTISPLIHGDLVIQTYVPESMDPARSTDPGGSARMAAVHKETGAEIWAVQLPDGRDSYNTPLLGAFGSEQVLYLVTWGRLLAYDPGTGNLRMSHEVPVYQCSPSVVADGRKVYISGGKVYYSGGMLAVATGEVEDRTRWQLREHACDIASPLLHEGLLYMVTAKGTASCVDAETGEVAWRKGIGGSYHASPVYADGKVYFMSTAGRTTVVRAGRELEVLARNELGERVQASPAVLGGSLLVRGREHLFCIGGGGAND